MAFFKVIYILKVSIHAPNEGSDADGNIYLQASSAFQSTLPMKGATEFLLGHQSLYRRFNPRSQ